MKNVLVFSHEGSHHAVELRWVREVFTLGFVTPVPGAPPVIAGLVNLRGAITPVLDLRPLLRPDASGSDAREGDSAVLLEVEGVCAAIAIAAVDEVSSLGEANAPRTLIDSRGRVVPLMDPPVLFRGARDAVNQTRRLALPHPEGADAS